MRIESSHDVSVVVHDLGGSGPPLLIAHATGFHGRTYAPLAASFTDRFSVYALDFRGHGDSLDPADDGVESPMDWSRYGDDATAVIDAVADRHGLGADARGIVAFGHSKGGASLLMAAHRRPDAFRTIVVFEPIVFPPMDEAGLPGPDSPMMAGALRRRARFDSVDEALDHYRTKPPMRDFSPDVLRAYVEGGLRSDDDGLTLKCSPVHEARTFLGGPRHRTWDLLAEIRDPVVVVAGTDDEPTGAIAPAIAEQLPNARFVGLGHLGHLGPMTHPDEVAAVVLAAIGQGGPDHRRRHSPAVRCW